MDPAAEVGCVGRSMSCADDARNATACQVKTYAQWTRRKSPARKRRERAGTRCLPRATAPASMCPTSVLRNPSFMRRSSGSQDGLSASCTACRRRSRRPWTCRTKPRPPRSCGTDREGRLRCGRARSSAWHIPSPLGFLGLMACRDLTSVGDGV